MPTKSKVAKKPHRPLRVIAAEIKAEIDNNQWAKHSAFYASPYLAAMLELNSIQDKYYLDSAREVVLRFLCNAQTWRGETARRIKAELKGMTV